MPSNFDLNSLVNPTEARKLAHPSPLTSCNPFTSDIEVGIGRGRGKPVSRFLMTHDKNMPHEVQSCY